MVLCYIGQFQITLKVFQTAEREPLAALNNDHSSTLLNPHLRLGAESSVVSADNVAATVRASDKQPCSFASIKVLDSEGSKGRSENNKAHEENS